MTKMLSFNQCLSLIAAIGHKRTVIIEGENGVGKTALYRRLKTLPQFANHIAADDPIDCTQLSDGSVWMPALDMENGISRELPNERFGVSKDNQRGVNGSRPIIVGLDEIAKAPQFIKNVLAPIIYERRVGNYHLPEGSVVTCFTNLTIEGLGDSIQAHLRNRLMFVKMRKPTAPEWINWAMENGINERVIAFVQMHPQVMDSFLDYEKGGQYAGKDLTKDNGMIFNPRSVQMAYASPRSLHAVSDIVTECDGVVDDDTLEAGIEGAMGPVATAQFMSFIRFGRDICSFERIIADPKKAPISENPTAQLVQLFQCVTRASTREEADKVVTYMDRAKEEMKAIFCNTVASSTRLSLYVTLERFSKMLGNQRIFFSTK